PEEPIQQLETPVLYFWSSTARAVQVDVGFPQGIVGQWYPEAASFTPELGALTKMASGQMSWQVMVDPAIDAAGVGSVSPDEIWAPSREVESTPVSYGGETEQFIFYRGLGMFDPPVRVEAAAGGGLRVRNAGTEAIDGVIVLRSGDAGGGLAFVGRVAAG